MCSQSRQNQRREIICVNGEEVLRNCSQQVWQISNLWRSLPTSKTFEGSRYKSSVSVTKVSLKVFPNSGISLTTRSKLFYGLKLQAFRCKLFGTSQTLRKSGRCGVDEVVPKEQKKFPLEMKGGSLTHETKDRGKKTNKSDTEANTFGNVRGGPKKEANGREKPRKEGIICPNRILRAAIREPSGSDRTTTVLRFEVGEARLYNRKEENELTESVVGCSIAGELVLQVGVNSTLRARVHQSAAVEGTMGLPTTCSTAMDSDSRDLAVAFQLKVVGVGAIFVAGMLGVSLPFIGRGLRFLSTEGNAFFISRAFAAGVILATGFVHILPEGMEALQNPCLPEFWLSFPFGGFIAMISALTTLFVDNLCTVYFEDLHSHQKQIRQNEQHLPLIFSKSTSFTDGRPDRRFLREKSLLRLGSHASEVIFTVKKLAAENLSGNSQHVHEIAVAGEGYLTEQEEAHIRNVVILQVLEVAVLSHSFIIGLSLGISENPRSITPLLAALSFHQFFEGFALGGSICQAAFECTSSTVRAGLFAITTPLGIIFGICIASSYRANTAKALIIEGLFECASAGILMYMALVALIAPDFRSVRLRSNRPLQIFAYVALFGGTLAMSSLALWA